MHKNAHFDVVVATVEDIDAIQGILYPHYFEESTYSGLTYDPENTRKMIEQYVSDVALVAKAEGKIVGFCAMSFVRTFYKETEADIDMFYVLPEWRGTGIARAFAFALTHVAEKHGAGAIYTSCLSGLEGHNNGQYVNLWKKYGFNTLGTVMVRLKHV